MADQKLSALTELATTPADNDEVYIRDVSEAPAAESKRITIANLLAGAGSAVVTAGSYTGNDTANRAIAHGLGVVPKVVLIAMEGASPRNNLLLAPAWINLISAITGYAVTEWTSTNFYVGNDPNYNNSGNETGTTYYWVAIA